MKKINNNQMRNYICAVLMIVLLLTQFLPFWECVGCKNHENKLISISAYLWFTDDHKPVTENMTDVYLEYFGAGLKDENGKSYKFRANDVSETPVAIVIATVVCLFMCFWKPQKVYATVSALIGGAYGIYGYLTNLALQCGRNWMIHFFVAVVVSVVAAVAIGFSVYKTILMNRR